MKKHFLFLISLLTTVCFSSCNSDDADKDPVLEVRNQVTFSSRSTSREITVSTNMPDWQAEVDNPAANKWCKIIPDKSGRIHFLRVEVEDNEDIDKRDAYIYITAGNLNRTVKVTQLGETDEIILSIDRKIVGSGREVFEVEVTSNFEYEVLPRANWIKQITPTGGLTTYAYTDNLLYFEVDEYVGINNRKGIIEFLPKDNIIGRTRNEGNEGNEGGEEPGPDPEGPEETLNAILTVTQNGTEVDLSEDEFLKPDLKINISRAEASDTKLHSEIGRSYDGNLSTMSHSNYGQLKDISLTYYLDNADRVDQVTIWGRTDAGVNGNWETFDVYAFVDGQEKHLMAGDFEGLGGVNTLELDVENPEYIKFVVHSGRRDNDTRNSVILAEIEFLKINKDKNKVTEIFTDGACSHLKPGVTLEEIEAITSPLIKSIALQMYNGTYEYDFRVENYKALKPKKTTADGLKVKDAFSRYENITGIFLPAGPSVVLVGEMYGRDVNLLLPNAMRQPTLGYPADKDPEGWGLKRTTIKLEEGVNAFEVPYDCNAYIEYSANDYATAPEITVHFPMGHVNEYFDYEKHNNADWNRLLNDAPGHIMDMKGKYMQGMFPVSYLRRYAYNQGVELMESYEKTILSHYEFMGIDLHNRMPENKLLARVNFNYFMFQDGDGASFIGNDGTMKTVLTPANIYNDSWGFCHELGHILQMGNLTTWGGLGEVSNNWLSMYTTTKFGQQSRLAKGNKYELATSEIILSNPKISYLQHSDVFCRLVPFWQLHLYFSRNGYPNFYPDLFEQLRLREPVGSGNTAIDNQFEFIKIACEVSGTDLTDFFDKWGFFYVGEIVMDDYGSYTYNVTQEQVDAVKTEIATKVYAQPKYDVTTERD